jgi:glycosyltransferase involved in cell wall biosynthesis
MKIALFSAFYPFRGGIAQFNERLTQELDKQHTVSVFSFKKQYPNWLFPGKSQYVENENSTWKYRAKRIVSTFNPVTYFSGIRKIKHAEPQLFIANYWMTLFSPMLSFFGYKLNGSCKRLLLVHNFVPHEKRFFDKWCNRLILKNYDGFVVLSETVKTSIKALNPNASVKVLYHPWYDHFNLLIPKEKARKKLNIPLDSKVLLFFGLIRKYKGLDTLLETFSTLDDSYFLIIAGEFYDDVTMYNKWLEDPKLKQRMYIDANFIPDDEVHLFFSTADLCVLPYRAATQSGVTATAFQFGVPVLATSVGALKESIGGKGLTVEPSNTNALKRGIIEAFQSDNIKHYKRQIEQDRSIYNWTFFTQEFLSFGKSL